MVLNDVVAALATASNGHGDIVQLFVQLGRP